MVGCTHVHFRTVVCHRATMPTKFWLAVTDTSLRYQSVQDAIEHISSVQGHDGQFRGLVTRLQNAR